MNMSEIVDLTMVAAVELVGGPFCGECVWWPVDERGLTLFMAGHGYRYEVRGSKAIYKA